MWCDDVNPIASDCELLTWYGIHNFCTVVGFFLPLIRTNALVLFLSIIYVYMGYYLWLGDIRHIVMFTVLVNNTKGYTSWWKSACRLKYIIFYEGGSERLFFSVGRTEIFVLFINAETGENNFHIYCYVHQIWQMNNICVYWYVEHTIPLLIFCYYKPWIIIIVSGHLTI